MSNEPLVGFPLLGVPDAQGQLQFPTPEQSVRQSIEVILRTRPGEQLQRPDFGAGLEDFTGQPNSVTTRRRILRIHRLAPAIIRAGSSFPKSS